MRRHSRRYVLVRFLSRDPIAAQVVERGLHSCIGQAVGYLGAAEMNARMIDFSEANGMAVICCRSDSVERLRAILALMTDIGGNPVAATVVRFSGTIKALRAPMPRHKKQSDATRMSSS